MSLNYVKVVRKRRASSSIKSFREIRSKNVKKNDISKLSIFHLNLENQQIPFFQFTATNSSCLVARRQSSSKETVTCQRNHSLKFYRRLSDTQLSRPTFGMDSSSTILSTPPSQSFLSSWKVPTT